MVKQLNKKEIVQALWLTGTKKVQTIQNKVDVPQSTLYSWIDKLKEGVESQKDSMGSKGQLQKNKILQLLVSSNNIKSLSKEQRILSLYQSGIKDATKIHRLVKRVCKISISTVYRIINKIKLGQPLQRKERDDKGIVKSISKPQQRAQQNQIKSYVPIEKPLLNEDKAKRRLQFAKKMKQQLKKNKHLLDSMVFTDETKFRTYNNEVGGNVYIKCTKEQRLDPQNVSKLYLFSENLTGQIYANEILKKHLKDSLKSIGLEIKDDMIVEDLDPKHSLRCKTSEQQAQTMEYHIVQDYPPLSPDLNPIENIWGLVKNAIASRRPSSLDELQKFAQEEWEKFDGEKQEILQSLIDSFPKRVQDVINSQGWYTEY
ncbi:hypothetical protein ABPG72_019955 [Tetrahymena utriculariae]